MTKRILSVFVLNCFFCMSLGPIPQACATGELNLPIPGVMVNLSPAYEPALIKGLTVHKDNPFLFDFIVDTGNDASLLAPKGQQSQQERLKAEGDRLVKYFFACLTIPEKDLWVNLSPYEKDRMIPQALGQTGLGSDLLAQDYILKQLTASLIYPEKDLGKKFWDRVYTKAQQLYGTSQVPVNTFNKVWILADKATVYEHGQTAFVVGGHLKVMLEEDYLAMEKHSSGVIASPSAPRNDTNALGSQIVRDLILPEIEHEVNTGKNFATLRQIFNSQILATWYKKNLKEALLNQVYADKSTVKGVNLNDPSVKEQIYQQYLKAYKKGVFNYIKEETDNSLPQSGEGQGGGSRTIPRKYFSGGFGSQVEEAMVVSHDPALARSAATPIGTDFDLQVAVGINRAPMQGSDAAMSASPLKRGGETSPTGERPIGGTAYTSLKDMRAEALKGEKILGKKFIVTTKSRGPIKLTVSSVSETDIKGLGENDEQVVISSDNFVQAIADAAMAAQKRDITVVGGRGPIIGRVEIDPKGKSVRAYDVNGNPLTGWIYTGETITALSFGNEVMAVASGKSLKAYDLKGNPQMDWLNTGSTITALNFSNGVIAVASGKSVKAYDVNGNPLMDWINTYDTITALNFGNGVMAVASGQLVMAYDLKGNPLTGWINTGETITALSFSNGVITVASGKSVRAYDVNRKPLTDWIRISRAITALNFSNGVMAVASGASVRAYDLKGNTLTDWINTGKTITALSFSNGVITVASGKSVRAYDVNGNPLTKWISTGETITALSFGNGVMAVASGASVRAYDVNRNPLTNWIDIGRTITALSFGNGVMAVASGESVRAYDVNGSPLLTDYWVEADSPIDNLYSASNNQVIYVTVEGNVGVLLKENHDEFNLNKQQRPASLILAVSGDAHYILLQQKDGRQGLLSTQDAKYFPLNEPFTVPLERLGVTVTSGEGEIIIKYGNQERRVASDQAMNVTAQRLSIKPSEIKVNPTDAAMKAALDENLLKRIEEAGLKPLELLRQFEEQQKGPQEGITLGNNQAMFKAWVKVKIAESLSRYTQQPGVIPAPRSGSADAAMTALQAKERFSQVAWDVISHLATFSELPQPTLERIAEKLDDWEKKVGNGQLKYNNAIENVRNAWVPLESEALMLGSFDEFMRKKRLADNKKKAAKPALKTPDAAMTVYVEIGGERFDDIEKVQKVFSLLRKNITSLPDDIDFKVYHRDRKYYNLLTPRDFSRKRDPVFERLVPAIGIELQNDGIDVTLDGWRADFDHFHLIPFYLTVNTNSSGLSHRQVSEKLKKEAEKILFWIDWQEKKIKTDAAMTVEPMPELKDAKEIAEPISGLLQVANGSYWNVVVRQFPEGYGIFVQRWGQKTMTPATETVAKFFIRGINPENLQSIKEVVNNKLDGIYLAGKELVENPQDQRRTGGFRTILQNNLQNNLQNRLSLAKTQAEKRRLITRAALQRRADAAMTVQKAGAVERQEGNRFILTYPRNRHFKAAYTVNQDGQPKAHIVITGEDAPRIIAYEEGQAKPTEWYYFIQGRSMGLHQGIATVSWAEDHQRLVVQLGVRFHQGADISPDAAMMIKQRQATVVGDVRDRVINRLEISDDSHSFRALNAAGNSLTSWIYTYRTITSWSWSADNQKIALASNAGDLRIYDVDKGAFLTGWIYTGGRPIRSSSWSADNQQIALASYDGYLTIYDVNQKTFLTGWIYTGRNVMLSSWSADNQQIALAGYDGDIRTFNVDKEIFRTDWINTEAAVRDLFASKTQIIYTTEEGKVGVRSSKKHEAFNLQEEGLPALRIMAVSEDGKHILLQQMDSGYGLLSIKDGKYFPLTLKYGSVPFRQGPLTVTSGEGEIIIKYGDQQRRVTSDQAMNVTAQRLSIKPSELKVNHKPTRPMTALRISRSDVEKIIIPPGLTAESHFVQIKLPYSWEMRADYDARSAVTVFSLNVPISAQTLPVINLEGNVIPRLNRDIIIDVLNRMGVQIDTAMTATLISDKNADPSNPVKIETSIGPVQAYMRTELGVPGQLEHRSFVIKAPSGREHIVPLSTWSNAKNVVILDRLFFIVDTYNVIAYQINKDSIDYLSALTGELRERTRRNAGSETVPYLFTDSRHPGEFSVGEYEGRPIIRVQIKGNENFGKANYTVNYLYQSTVSVNISDWAMRASTVQSERQLKAFPGGIDLNAANMGLSVTKDADGGVKVNFDPAMIEQIRKNGVQSVVPIIINMTVLPVGVVPALLGLAPRKEPATTELI